MALSDTRILELKPSAKPYKVRDSEGLYLEVRPTGSRLWRYRYRLEGKENMYAIGPHPEVKVVDARKARDAARKLVRQGINPSHHRKRQQRLNIRRGDDSFEAITREWLDSMKFQWSDRTVRQRERLFEKYVFPDIGGVPIQDLTRAQGLKVIQKIEKRSARLARMAMRSISAVSRMACETDRADTELVYRHAGNSKPTPRSLSLRPEEIPEFFTALAGYAEYFPTKGALHLLWLTLARPKEILEARWWEFDLADRLWVVPAERMSMGRSHRVPLPTQAVAVLEKIRTVSGQYEHVIPNQTDPTRHASQAVLTKALRAIGFEGRLGVNAIRLTGHEILCELGYPREALDRQLAHVSSSNAQVYYQGDLLEARREVMQHWADYLDQLVRTASLRARHQLP